MVRIAVTGAAGRMGREVLAAAADRENCEVDFAVNRTSVDEPISGVVIESTDNFEALLDDYQPDVVVDFTGPESAIEYSEACAETGVGFVTGTTGFDDEGIAELKFASESTAVLKASNFSRGVAALRLAVQEATAALPDADIELTETHHNAKRDAPSGTAKTLLDDIEGVREDLSERVHGREGEAPRSTDEIGVHARRAGDIAGEHEVLLGGSNEALSLTHRAGDRSIFADGALDAAEWLAEREAGWYDFFEVIED
ncbi:dihydrodipicolinate reductase [Halohasta litchfieldiae]|uniref:4-hydroxy-tetrahydrodipicolinate reductase n=1 Tax=Halohasta litchfieldiae TaxID=1073996 RepID=A0A1H6Y5K8_9EURY|nr:4-hydroxy-tetrahydrodipicolinate reductase [Halohasta litchfieldiae]ATW87095.1 dihydrodipicolinate reductase [Halohasta litchfieldiae]SEJ35184.1 dihydrodipicolinate reductase [Halohasta litchfieldiae]